MSSDSFKNSYPQTISLQIIYIYIYIYTSYIEHARCMMVIVTGNGSVWFGFMAHQPLLVI